jgi:hypothetical protein
MGSVHRFAGLVLGAGQILVAPDGCVGRAVGRGSHGGAGEAGRRAESGSRHVGWGGAVAAFHYTLYMTGQKMNGGAAEQRRRFDSKLNALWLRLVLPSQL